MRIFFTAVSAFGKEGIKGKSVEFFTTAKTVVFLGKNPPL